MLLLVILGLVSGAADARPAEPDDGSSRRLLSLGPRWEMTLAPGNELYPVYLADPLRTTFAFQQMYFSDTEIFDSGTKRFGLKIGGRLPLLRIHPRGKPDRGFQANLEVGFIGQFDSDHSLDNIGWDGIYSLIFYYKPRGNAAIRFGVHHTSSHRGDEYVERTGRLRINHTRQEFLVGLSRKLGKRWHIYGEAASAYDLRNEELQERGRLQAGLQYEIEDIIWKRRLGWYAALDCSAFEERDWNINATVQTGLILSTNGHAWRVGIEHYNGRSWMGEFFQDDEHYTALGIWFDL
jgi:hypothetical protein